MLWTYAICNLNGKEIVGTFYEKELQKTNQKEFRIEKVIKWRGDKQYVKWKGYDNSFNSWIGKKRHCYFPPYSHSRNKIEVRFDLSNYGTKSDLKNATGVDDLLKMIYLT